MSARLFKHADPIAVIDCGQYVSHFLLIDGP